MSAFAMVKDLGSKWEHSTGDALADLNQALDEAAVLITAALLNAGKTVDGTPEDVLKLVSVRMVRQAFPPPDDTPMMPPIGSESMQIGVGPFQQTVRFGGSGSGRLWLGPDERKLLGLSVQKAFSLDLLPAGWVAP